MMADDEVISSLEYDCSSSSCSSSSNFPLALYEALVERVRAGQERKILAGMG